MDPFTSATTVLTVVGMAIKVGRETFALTQGIRGSPNNVQRLATELESLYTLLATLQELIERIQTQNDRVISDMLQNLETILTNCIKVFLDVRRTLNPLLDANGDASVGIWKGFLWASSKRDDVDVLQQTLGSYKAMLNLSFAALSALYTSRIEESIANIDGNTSQAKDTLEQILTSESRMDNRLDVIQKAVKRLQLQFDNKEREELLRERKLQPMRDDSPEGTQRINNRLSIASYSSSLRMSLYNLESIISSPAISRAPSMAISLDTDRHTSHGSVIVSEGLVSSDDNARALSGPDAVKKDMEDFKALVPKTLVPKTLVPETLVPETASKLQLNASKCLPNSNNDNSNSDFEATSGPNDNVILSASLSREIAESELCDPENRVSNTISDHLLGPLAASRKLTGHNTHGKTGPLDIAEPATLREDARVRDRSASPLNGTHPCGDSRAKGGYKSCSDGQGGPQGLRRDGSRSLAESAEDSDPEKIAFWIPQCTSDGRLYYFNTFTGNSQMKPPLQPPTLALVQDPVDNADHVEHGVTSRSFMFRVLESPLKMSPQSPTNYWHDSGAELSPQTAPTLSDQFSENSSTRATFPERPLRSQPPHVENSERELMILDLKDRVDDWKGQSIHTFGDLLLQDVILVSAPQNLVRTYHAYLFERIFLCFTVKTQSRTSSMQSDGDERLQHLRLKGRVFMKSITHLTSASTKGQSTIQVFFRNDSESEVFKMYFDDPYNMAVWLFYFDQQRLALKSSKSQNSPQSPKISQSPNFPNSRSLRRSRWGVVVPRVHGTQ